MYNRLTLTLLLVVVILAINSTWVVYKKKRESETLMNISKERVEDLRKRETDLNYKIQRLDTDVGLEEEIRSKFSVTKEGESMVVVVPKTEYVATTSTKKDGLWSRFVNIFK
ncbi:MAG: hypothetical protein WAW92_02850 [Minisyncoccia bacterium]